ncbi:uncharacterized protein LOC130922567 [Corythoichthys intestinalis]|uniref:uncharacterized protein LOC130922567 n=1 Tax=Corythoichthys intestinalis TaxID=161448 RepID=UPI0025A5554D|nr:uncharacterized protein LOC130922567 [Corythoichthys intestinalis]
MTSVEKRRSSRKSGGHRKQSDGGFSDTSSGGSFLDETDREVRTLTDKAFRSLCIGDEAVYNDSDLGPASPYIQRDRHRAFSQGRTEKEDNDMEELKRAANESFSLMVQQYEQDWINEGMYGADMNRNSQWDGCGDRTHEKVSATFQDCFMEMTQENRSLGEDPIGYFSNGPTDLSLQHRRSRSRVSSLIRAFNTEDGGVMDDQLREWNNEAQWNRPGLMNTASSYQQNFTNGHFPMVGQFSSQNTNLYSTEAGAVHHMHTASSLMRLSHYNQNMMTQVDCNTNFFIHSELSPFKVWRDHNRFQQEEVSRFMQCSEFPKWGKTPMYKELPLDPQMNGSSMFQGRSRRHNRTMMATVAPKHPLQSISTSARLQKASALEKRCESEKVVHHPHRTRTQSLGTNRLQSQRPSTASPTVETPTHFQETIKSVKGHHQQVKITSEPSINHQMNDNRHNALCNDTLFGVKTERSIASHYIGTASNAVQLLSPQAEPPESRQDTGSPQLVEHPPVRAESRGGTPDVRMSSYKSRASSILFNLKDNRKRVKSTYSPAKFKGFETTEKSIEPPFQKSKDIVIDIPECLQPDLQESSWTDSASHQYVKPYHSPTLLSPGMISQPDKGHIPDYKATQRQNEIVHQSGYIAENDTSNDLNSGQNYNEDLPPFCLFRQDVANFQGGTELYTRKSFHNTTDMRWQMDENKEVAHLKEADMRHFTEGAHLNQKKLNHSGVSKGRWRPPDALNIRQLSPNEVDATWDQDTSPFIEKHQNAMANLQTTTAKEISSHRDDHGRENQQDTNKEAKKTPQNDAPVRNPTYYGQDRTENYFHQNKNVNVNKTDMYSQETSQYAPSFKQEQPKPAEQQYASESQNTSSIVPERTERLHQVKNEQSVEVKAVQITPKQIQSEQRQTEESKAQKWGHQGHSKDDTWQDTGFIEEHAQTATTIKTRSDQVKLEQDETQERKMEQIRGKEKDRTNEKQTAPTQVRDDEEEANNVKVQAVEMTGVQSGLVQAEQTDLKDLKGKERSQESGKIQPSQTDNTTLVEVEAKQRRIEQEGERKMLEEVKARNFTEDVTIATQINTEKAKLQTNTERVNTKMEGKGGKNEQTDKKPGKESTINAQPKKEIQGAKETNSVARKVELAKVELTNMELAKVALIKHQHIKERSSKPAAFLIMQRHVKSEPNKVERVKAELAKAKVELSKIKQKMKGEKREKDRCTMITKEHSVANKDESAEVTNIQLTAQTTDKSAAKKAYNTNQEHHGDDYYQTLREKYGFTNSVSQKMSPGVNSSSNGNNVTLSLDVTKVNNDNPNNEFAKLSVETNNMEKANKVNESLYVYSESSKEFKLSQEDCLVSCADKRANGDRVTDTGKDDTVKIAYLTYPDSHCAVSSQTQSESIRNPERKPKSERLKAMPQREKGQTKQQILTSKIKAHAEKEISALIEGFALREALTPKTTTKQLPAGHLKQKLSIHEVLSGHEISIPTNSTTKHQGGSPGIEDNAVYSSKGMDNQTVNQLQKRLPQEPTKSNNFTLENPAKEMKRTPGQSESREQQADNYEIKTAKQNKDQEPKDLKDKTVVQLNENSEKIQLESLSQKSDSPMENTKSSQTTGKLTVVHKDFDFGQTNNSVAEDSLQIMGISVTEVKVNNENKVVNAEHSKSSSAEPYFHSIGMEMSKKSECLIHIGTTHARETHPIEQETALEVCMNIQGEETIEKSLPENLTEKLEFSPLLNPKIHVEPQSKIQVKETMPGKDVTPAHTLNSINKATDETQLLHDKQDIAVAEMDAPCTLETPDLVKCCNIDHKEIQTGQIDSQLKQVAAKSINSGLNYIQDPNKAVAITQSVTPSLEEDVTPAVSPSEDVIKNKTTPLPEENKYDRAIPHLNKIESKNASPKLKEANTGVMNQLIDAHIDNAVVTVVPAVKGDDLVEKQENKTRPVMAAVEELQHNAPFSAGEKMSASTKDHEAKHPASKGSEEKMQEKLEDKLSVKNVLASVKKLSDSMKLMDQLNSVNPAKKDTKTDMTQTFGTISNKQSSEGDYFQVEGIPFRNNNTQTDVSDVSKGVEHSERSLNKSGLESQDKSMRKHKTAVIEKSNIKQTEGSSGLQSCEKVLATQTTDMGKQQSEFRSSSSTRERHNSRNSQQTTEEPAVKSKPKVRMSTIPEISALADYARLKVIVSEDRENTIPEFPPHRKEGFFPLIQSRHSRRPVFFTDTQEHSVNDKSEQKKMEIISKVIKEPKPVVFPITEKEHRRTGMFKLGEKEKPEKTIFDVKDHEGVVEKQPQALTQKKTICKSHNENEVDRQEAPKIARTIVSQFNKESILNSPINKQRESLQLHQKVDEITIPDAKVDHLMLMEKNSSTESTFEPVCQDGTSKSRNTINKVTAGEIKFEKSRKGKLETYPEETKAKKEGDAKDQHRTIKRGEKRLSEEEKVKIEERRAFLSEERKRAQREAARWEKLKETAQKKEEERKARQTEGRRSNPINDERRIEREEENSREAQDKRGGSISVRERRLKQRPAGRTAQEDEQIRAVLIEEQRLTKRIEQRRLAEEIRLKKIQERLREEQRKVKQKSVQQMARENKEETHAAETQIVSAKLREKPLDEGEMVHATQELIREDDLTAEREVNFVAQREKVSTSEEQNREEMLMDALQYYTITSTSKKPKERQKHSPLTLQHGNPSSVPSEGSGFPRGLHRPQAQPSPAPSLPRSTTSSPALGGKPSMFRVKDNTKGSTFKSVKPRFHKNLVDESRMGLPMEWRAEKREDEREIMRRHTGTPINPDVVTGINQLAPINESPISQPVSSLQDNSALPPPHRPFCRRSIALDDDDSRSVFSNISEDVQSIATSVADVADLRGLCDSERPVSACSFSSDMSRFGKPPAVPPKSEQALRKAQRLTTRRIRKEVTQSTATNPAGKSHGEASSRPASTSTEVWSLNCHAVASPHFSPPVSLTHAPTFGPSLPSTHRENQHLLPFHASPHTTATATLPSTSPNVTATESLHHTAPLPHPAFLTPAAVSIPVTSAHAATPVPVPAASPPVITSAPHPTTSLHTTAPVHSFTFPHAASPVSRHATTPRVTSPKSHPVASPHSTSFSKHQAVSPHITGLSSKPATTPLASAHILATVNHPPTSLHVTASVAHPFPYIPALVSHPVATPHAPAPITFPVSSPNSASQITHPAAASKIVHHVPSSPTLHYTTHPAPVTQYHVESSYPQSYPLTQRKVLQDLGSGQYFLVDAPIEVKMKTFLDPETGKYVQLNVRESGQNIFQPHLQPVLTQPLFPQLHFQPPLQLEQQHKLLSPGSSAENTFTLHQGYQSYPQGYKPPRISSMSSQMASSGVSVQDEPYLENNSITNRSNETRPKIDSQRCSPEQTPYMDTVNDTNKTQNIVYSTHESFSGSDSSKQLADSLCENDNSVYSSCRPCDIIPMSELDDFMEMTDW